MSIALMTLKQTVYRRKQILYQVKQTETDRIQKDSYEYRAKEPETDSEQKKQIEC